MPAEVAPVAAGLQYRDFLTVDVLASRLRVTNTTVHATLHNLIPDRIYVQEPDVRVGRLQIFNN